MSANNSNIESPSSSDKSSENPNTYFWLAYHYQQQYFKLRDENTELENKITNQCNHIKGWERAHGEKSTRNADLMKENRDVVLQRDLLLKKCDSLRANATDKQNEMKRNAALEKWSQEHKHEKELNELKVEVEGLESEKEQLHRELILADSIIGWGNEKIDRANMPPPPPPARARRFIPVDDPEHANYVGDAANNNPNIVAIFDPVRHVYLGVRVPEDFAAATALVQYSRHAEPVAAEVERVDDEMHIEHSNEEMEAAAALMQLASGAGAVH